MAQRLRNITLGAPGFKGINTEESPIALDPQFAQVADNCVIDKFGRLGSRKGYVRLTDADQATALSGESVKHIADWNRVGNPSVLVAVGNNKIFYAEDDSGGTLNHLTEFSLPASYSITGNDWVLVDFNGKMYFYQDDHSPLVLNETSYGTGSLVLLTDESSDTNPLGLESSVAMAAYGRVWAASSDRTTLHWSDTLIGEDFAYTGPDSGGTFAGAIDMSTVWPDGYDEIQAVAGHNGRLVIFGRHSVVVYAGAEDPTSMTLEDSFGGIGCLNQWTIKSLGNDMLFMSDSGLRSLSRTVLDGSGAMPETDVSKNVRQELLNLVTGSNVNDIVSAYSPEEALYLLIFQNTGDIYAFDTKGKLQDQSYRATTWLGSPFTCAHRATDTKLYVGGTYGVGEYSGYLDDDQPYIFSYESPVLTFGDNAALKFIKSVRPVIIGGASQEITIGWGYRYDGGFNTQTYTIDSNAGVAEFNIAEYNINEFSGGTFVTDRKVNATGSGRNVRLQVECRIDGSQFSLQEMNVQALLGRIL